MSDIKVVGVIFKRSGKVIELLQNSIELKVNDKVVIELDKGEDLVDVLYINKELSETDEKPDKSIVRVATEKDIAQAEINKVDEPKAFAECKRLTLEAKIDMKLLATEYTLDRSKLTFYFTAEGRVDFRQLVKDLARIFRTRIEMRQIGVRDATKMVGGFGLCGREFCCSCFLRKFDNISIKMAKNQNLILNPNKISGVCGRLMCCLMFEKDGYECGCEGGCGTNNCNDEEFIEINEDFEKLLKS